MVTPKQAEELQLAMEHGMISLSMRNPSDRKMANSDDKEIVSLKDFGPNASLPPEPVVVEKTVYVDRPAPAVAEAPKPEPTKAQFWRVTVLRGNEKSDVDLQIKKK